MLPASSSLILNVRWSESVHLVVNQPVTRFFSTKDGSTTPQGGIKRDAHINRTRRNNMWMHKEHIEVGLSIALMASPINAKDGLKKYVMMPAKKFFLASE
jgi:hypothetical protein